MPQAAVLRAFRTPLEICEIELLPLRRHEVRVKLAASGVCRSDFGIYNEKYPSFPLPILLGHEGAGIVLEIGEGVENVEPGDHVVIAGIPRCGECYWCRRGQTTLCETHDAFFLAGQLDGVPRLALGGKPVHQFTFCGTFSEETIVPSISLVRIDPEMPLDVGALIGCAVITGIGASEMVDLRGDDSAVVLGAGGVGLNVIQGLRKRGVERIIAVDLLPWKLELARTFGATDAVDASGGDAVEQIKDLTGGRGADVGFDAIGTAATLKQIVQMVRRGGEAVVVGFDASADISTQDVARVGKTLRGCIYGMTDVVTAFPRLVAEYQSGELMLDELVTRRLPLSGINDALAAIEAGDVARSLIVFDGAGV